MLLMLFVVKGVLIDKDNIALNYTGKINTTEKKLFLNSEFDTRLGHRR